MHKTILPWLTLLVASISAFADTCEIDSKDKLQNLNGCGCSDNIVLTGDEKVLDMSGVIFTPLCSGPDGFSGVFDGNGFTISNLYITETSKFKAKVAFIALLKGGTLKNLTFQDPVIEVTKQNGNSQFEASVAVAVAELQSGSVENVHVHGGSVSVKGGNQANIDAGGLAGTAGGGSISESDGDEIAITGTGATVNVGGICGNVTGDVTLTSVTYSGDAPVAGSVANNVTLTSKYGAVTITEINSTKSAEINGGYTAADTVKITSDIAVNNVTLNRTFTQNVLSSLFLPFSISASQISGATKIYQFNRVAQNDVGIWKVKVSAVTELTSNTPYMVLPSADGKLTFNINEPVVFNTTTGPETHSVINDTWEFKGVYAHVDFDENFPDVSRVYGFASVAADGYNAGDFVKVGVGADIPAMRAYLIHHSAPLQKSSAGVLGQSVIPDVIEIEVEDETGIIVGTGKLNTVTGEIRMDRWFDLNGRKLNSKPTAKGTYYKNGKKAIIK